MSDHVERLVAQMAWADERVILALRRAARANDRALALYAHVLGAEHVWLTRLEGRDATVAVWPELDLDGCGRLAAENHAAYRRYVSRLSGDDLDRTVHYRNSAGDEFDSTIEDILLQVATHGAYHRGQIALLLRDAGNVPEPTDYIAFVRGAPAATRDDIR